MRVWLYYRLSRDEDDELNSLTNQRKIIYEYAVTNGHEVVGESFDDNVSGMPPTRTARSFSPSPPPARMSFIWSLTVSAPRKMCIS